MFGFGNSKQKKYKKALEEFLQKMMSVKDYFEIIQARGKGHAQMAEMLGVKVSDTDYWAKEHFEEYKSRLSESNDPLAEIELRLKNYSFIKKEMEVFINYAKELEMNLTQGFVDDYYAVVATLKSLDLVKKEFSDESLYDENGFRSEGEKNSKEHKIGVWKTYKTEDNGVTEYLTSEIKWVDHPIHGKFGVTTRSDEKVFFKNGALKSHSYSPSLNSEEYENSIQKSGFKGEIYLKIYYYENGNIYHEEISSLEPNAWFETTLNQNGELISQGHIKNGLRNGNWRISKESTHYIPIIVKVISDESIIEDKLSNATKGDEIAFSITDKSSSIAPKIKDSVVVWSTVDYDDTNRGYPFSDGIFIIDLKNAYTADESKSDLVNELASKETLYKIEIDGRSNILEISAEQTKSYHYQIEFTSGGESKFENETKLSASRFELLKYVDGDVFESIDEFYVGLDNKIIDIKRLSEIYGYYDYDIGDGNRVEGEFINIKEAREGFNKIKSHYKDENILYKNINDVVKFDVVKLINGYEDNFSDLINLRSNDLEFYLFFVTEFDSSYHQNIKSDENNSSQIVSKWSSDYERETSGYDIEDIKEMFDEHREVHYSSMVYETFISKIESKSFKEKLFDLLGSLKDDISNYTFIDFLDEIDGDHNYGNPDELFVGFQKIFEVEDSDLKQITWEDMIDEKGNFIEWFTYNQLHSEYPRLYFRVVNEKLDMSEPVYTHEPDLKRGAFSTHKFELQKDDGIKVAEGWSLMLRSIIDGDYEVEEEAFFILPHVGRYGYTSDIVLFMHGNPFKEGEDYHQKILEKERKKSEYVDDIVMIDERDYEEFDSYDEAYDVWIKTVKLWIDDLDKKT